MYLYVSTYPSIYRCHILLQTRAGLTSVKTCVIDPERVNCSLEKGRKDAWAEEQDTHADGGGGGGGL